MSITRVRASRVTGPLLKTIGMFLDNPNNQFTGADIMHGTKLMSGTIYPLLARLAKIGWLQKSWEDIDPSVENRPPRRLYRLTKGGHKEAMEIMAEYSLTLPTFQAINPVTI